MKKNAYCVKGSPFLHMEFKLSDIFIIQFKYIYIYEQYKQEKYHWKKLCVSSFEIFYFYLNHKENKVKFFTEHFQRKNNLLYHYGGCRVAFWNGITFRGLRFKTSWKFHPFLLSFFMPHVFKRKYYFYQIS